MGQTEISGRCYGKNGEWSVIDFACVKSCCVGILHNLSNMRQKPSAGFGLHLDRVPVAYQRTCPNASEARPMQLRYERMGMWEVNDYWWVNFWKVIGPSGLEVVGFRYSPRRWYRWGGGVHMNRGKVGEGRGGKETDGCPLTQTCLPHLFKHSQTALILTDLVEIANATVLYKGWHHIVNFISLLPVIPHKQQVASRYASSAPVYLFPDWGICTILDALVKITNATVLYLTLPDNISESDLLYKLHVF
jgi:hypothetical protein